MRGKVSSFTRERVRVSFNNQKTEASMKNVMLVGGGKIGIAITELLSNTGDYHVTVVDRDAASLERMPHKNVTVKRLDLTDPKTFAQHVKGQDVVLSATPYSLTAT